LVLLLVLLSAALHAGWNAFIKSEPDTRAASVLVVIGAALVSALMATFVGPGRVPLDAWDEVLFVGVVEGLYFATLAGVLTRLPLQSAYGLSRGLGLLLVWPISVFWLGEEVTAFHLIGAATLSLGMFCLVQRTTSRAGIAWALMAASTIALYPVGYKRALTAGVSPYPLFSLSLAVGLFFILPALGRSAFPRLRAAAARSPWRLSFSAMTCAASFLIFLYALETGGAGRLTALRNTSVLFASLFGWLSGEPMTRRSILAALLMTTGAVLVAD
jgi:drug/metabolite transporter (DMT)-like permease